LTSTVLGAPGTLYHYCSASAFFKIIESRKLRFSDILSFNDSTEFYWIFDVLKSNQKYLDFKDKYPEESKIIFQTPVHWQLKSYVCCFSAKNDQLSQWRGYADNAQGFSIGFRTSHLSNIAFHQQKVCLEKVLYNEPEQNEKINAFIDQIEGSIQSQATSKASHVSALLELSKHFHRMAVTFKQPGFVEENEYRLIFQFGNDSPEFRELDYIEKKNQFFPVIHADYQTNNHDSAIDSIMLGPENPNKWNIFNLQMMYTKYTELAIGFDLSSTPYRN